MISSMTPASSKISGTSPPMLQPALAWWSGSFVPRSSTSTGCPCQPAVRDPLFRAAAILEREAGGFHQASPTRALLLDVGLELGAGLAGYFEPLSFELPSDVGIGVCGHRRAGQPLEGGGRGPFLHQKPEPDLGGELGISELRESGYVRQGMVARCPRGCERLERAGAHVGQGGVDL